MKLPFDKNLHIAFGMSKNAYMAIGAGASILAGVGKEIRDKVTGKGTPERADAFYTIFAGFAGILIYEFIKTLF